MKDNYGSGFPRASSGHAKLGTVLQRRLGHRQCDRSAAAREANGAYGYAMSVPPDRGAAAFAYASRHMKHHKRLTHGDLVGAKKRGN
jgi:hypothetical protein